jgi:hypothetical protein
MLQNTRVIRVQEGAYCLKTETSGRAMHAPDLFIVTPN